MCSRRSKDIDSFSVGRKNFSIQHQNVHLRYNTTRTEGFETEGIWVHESKLSRCKFSSWFGTRVPQINEFNNIWVYKIQISWSIKPRSLGNETHHKETKPGEGTVKERIGD